MVAFAIVATVIASHAAQRDMLIRDIIDRMRHDGLLRQMGGSRKRPGTIVGGRASKGDPVSDQTMSGSREDQFDRLLSNDSLRLDAYKFHEDRVEKICLGYGQPWRGWRPYKAPFSHLCPISSISGLARGFCP